MRMSEFEMPPMQDALIVGKRAPIGPEASLASTKAKKEKDNLVLGYSGMIDEIAI
jgi:hypothetical protein